MNQVVRADVSSTDSHTIAPGDEIGEKNACRAEEDAQLPSIAYRHQHCGGHAPTKVLSRYGAVTRRLRYKDLETCGDIA